MRWYLNAKFGKRSRSTNFEADGLADATVKAKVLANFYATGQGVYGPQCWREGRLQLISPTDETYIIRHEVPAGWTVIDGGKKF